MLRAGFLVRERGEVRGAGSVGVEEDGGLPVRGREGGQVPDLLWPAGGVGGEGVGG